jgi:curli production assembly/transport component CsgE
MLCAFSYYCRIFLLTGLSFFCIPSAAQIQDSTVTTENSILSAQETNTGPSDSRVFEEEIGQLLLDQTYSKVGNDFQQIFNTQWNWPEQTDEQFIIFIKERPAMGNSSIIEISINDLKVFESFLQPRLEALEEIAAQAIDVTTQYIINYNEVIKQLEGEEMSGTGIY